MIMPGFAATPVDTSTVKSGLSCPHCELLLKDPVQTEEGLRLCRSCFDEIVKYVQLNNQHVEYCNFMCHCTGLVISMNIITII